ncbi:ubiquitin-conjugating enzyme E2 T-like [Eriocheir sinensis]|uniref:ubiquitin-conjugating enzyme E2 T-like n=1 Tax=Eriocheir sinensis TaxID=95602 RepID=UPI0021CA0FFE|nr:ubiquitin-conjugating enzyme E2 T-like [Eriocheir sinensis]XP_050731141.1 ubiquitin-conjugating enzyme E2 T-like [Eriocheir sinensis]XP_050731142.1 ubiquitin-conjugating enzyme E2 T-like [Eriocheir sinensis]XP_050731143.1 ubiquitin-conjugating enzyme E2 T-like [Eriocheir sinensis]XP_050731145.1 ubiquitin-conjugating enzyme E2 T-like [Eriocheir sinensis]XP_050731146.1 ubiquitin-conjugating enzyme E2 T-like [Eriocheir sinensis]XP_050731147.1 ubiquitin-conjugating enzyme E2 T-like [Eriocheir 
MAQRVKRLQKECQQLKESPPVGVACWPEGDNLGIFRAVIRGEEDTVYDGGIFHLEMEVPERYPFHPPKVRFLTKVYHPNIDSAGRICLDLLKMPPSGSWRPIHNLSSVLTSVRLLLSSPNPEDPLMTDIAEEYQLRRTQYEATAKEWTAKYAQSDDPEGSLVSEARGSKRSSKLTGEDEERSKKAKM